MIFRLIDSPFLSSWQSGVFYADRLTPKSSLAPVAAAARKWRTAAPAGCAKLLRPKPVVDWKRRTLVCDADCAYEARYVRLPGSRVVATTRGRAIAGIAAPISRPAALPGSYRILLRVTALPYRADAFTATSPALRL
jgi:hypothetical protein